MFIKKSEIECDRDKLYKLAENIYYLSTTFERSGQQVYQGRTETFAEIAHAIAEHLKDIIK
jgi:hypothetical protein